VTKCLQCQSERIVQGEIVNSENRGAAVFRPHSLKAFAFTFSQGPELVGGSSACLDCGLVWSSVSTTELATFLKKHCDERISS
jgi:hypothetical protein